jgi:UDP-N-acetylmuramoyl-L-alanyl-D-glutamate--2,6-diaminopimelate ligase
MTELAFPSGLAQRSAVVGLRAIRDLLRPDAAPRFRDVAVEGLAFHSDEVRAGNLFFAIRGTRDDGSRHVQHALTRGAVAVVGENDMNVPCPVLVVPNARVALADVAASYYGHPSRALDVVGVTGTNGKTTVTHLIRACLEADRRPTGVIGTIGVEYAGRRLPTHNTTPDPVRLNGHLREMVDRKVAACAIEVSSHALSQERVRGIDFKAGVFLNLSQDHLDYHQDMRQYARAKARLFAQLKPGANACIALDAAAANVMREAVPAGVRLHTFGLHKGSDVRAVNLSCSLEGTRFELVMPNGRVDLWLRLPGEHNVRNALAAASAALALGVSELTIAAALESTTPPRGRLELVGYRGGVRAFVDYAHTPDALDKVCGTLRRLGGGRLIVVFGCGGDRDRGKRPLMARAVVAHADIAVMTSDNPRSEDPEAILDEMARGLEALDADAGRAAIYRVVDRLEAIRLAVHEARPGDTVLIAGKGHETYQVLGDSVVPFDDAVAVREALEAQETAL